MVTKWKFIGGRLCLDFVNTVGGWVGGAFADTVLRDKFSLYEDLPAWAEDAGALSQSQSRRLRRRAASDAQTAASVMARAIELRGTLYRIFKSVVENWTPRPADMAMLQGELSLARARQRLAYAAGAFAWRWDHSEGPLEGVLWPVVASAADLLTSSELAMMGQCGGEECGWFFLDTSRNHTRQWCNMKECGNRAKVRRFRERMRPPAPSEGAPGQPKSLDGRRKAQ